jgi:hypothetical protein
MIPALPNTHFHLGHVNAQREGEKTMNLRRLNDKLNKQICRYAAQRLEKKPLTPWTTIYYLESWRNTGSVVQRVNGLVVI